ncbi:MAG: hypothetical protein WBL67_14935 [Nitrososphaeraceae archaeon]
MQIDIVYSFMEIRLNYDKNPAAPSRDEQILAVDIKYITNPSSTGSKLLCLMKKE